MIPFEEWMECYFIKRRKLKIAMYNIKVDIINLEYRTDRKERVLKSLMQIEDLEIDERNIFKAHKSENNGALGCAISHFSVIAEFIKQTQYDYQIIFEDDIEFKHKVKLQELLQSLKEKFDCFLFAHNNAFMTENLDDIFSRVINSATTSGYIITRGFAPILLEKFGESINNLSKFAHPEQKNIINSLFAIDVLWKQLQITHKFIATVPSIGYQYESFSDIELKKVNYGV